MEPYSSQDQISPAALDILRESGWYAGRDVSPSFMLPVQFTTFQEAEKVLKEFGGLRIGKCGAGIDFAAGDVEIDPGLAVHLKKELDDYERALKLKLYPLGEAYRGDVYLVIDERGQTYLLSDELAPFAPSFPRTLEMLLLGKNADAAEIETAWKKRPTWHISLRSE